MKDDEGGSLGWNFHISQNAVQFPGREVHLEISEISMRRVFADLQCAFLVFSKFIFSPLAANSVKPNLPAIIYALLRGNKKYVTRSGSTLNFFREPVTAGHYTCQ